MPCSWPDRRSGRSRPWHSRSGSPAGPSCPGGTWPGTERCCPASGSKAGRPARSARPRQPGTTTRGRAAASVRLLGVHLLEQGEAEAQEYAHHDERHHQRVAGFVACIGREHECSQCHLLSRGVSFKPRRVGGLQVDRVRSPAVKVELHEDAIGAGDPPRRCSIRTLRGRPSGSCEAEPLSWIVLVAGLSTVNVNLALARGSGCAGRRSSSVRFRPAGSSPGRGGRGAPRCG